MPGVNHKVCVGSCLQTKLPEKPSLQLAVVIFLLLGFLKKFRLWNIKSGSCTKYRLSIVLNEF